MITQILLAFDTQDTSSGVCGLWLGSRALFGKVCECLSKLTTIIADAAGPTSVTSIWP